LTRSPPRVAAEGGIACGYICQRVQIVGSINISGRNETSYLQHLLTAFLFHTNFTPNPLKITLLATSATAIPRLSFIPRHQRAGIHSARRASAPRSPMLLEWRSSHSKLPLLLRLAARAWQLGGVGEHLGSTPLPTSPSIEHTSGEICTVALPKPTTSGRNHPVAQMFPSKIIFQRQFAKYGLECPLRDHWKVFGSMDDLRELIYAVAQSTVVAQLLTKPLPANAPQFYNISHFSTLHISQGRCEAWQAHNNFIQIFEFR